MLEPIFDAGSGRDAIGIGQVAGKGLNTRHGTILTLEDISVSFDGFKALNDLNLYIGVGELRCIIGPNGAGKTTLMDVITGKTRPSHGKAWFGETLDLTRMSEVQIAQAGIGREEHEKDAETAPLKPRSRGRSVEPVSVSRRRMMLRMSTSAWVPCWVAMETCRPSSASTARFRGR